MGHAWKTPFKGGFQGASDTVAQAKSAGSSPCGEAVALLWACSWLKVQHPGTWGIQDGSHVPPLPYHWGASQLPQLWMNQPLTPHPLLPLSKACQWDWGQPQNIPVSSVNSVGRALVLPTEVPPWPARTSSRPSFCLWDCTYGLPVLERSPPSQPSFIGPLLGFLYCTQCPPLGPGRWRPPWQKFLPDVPNRPTQYGWVCQFFPADPTYHQLVISQCLSSPKTWQDQENDHYTSGLYVSTRGESPWCFLQSHLETHSEFLLFSRLARSLKDIEDQSQFIQSKPQKPDR